MLSLLVVQITNVEVLNFPMSLSKEVSLLRKAGVKLKL